MPAQQRAPMPPAPAAAASAPVGNGTRSKEVFILGDDKNAAIPDDIRQLYRQDDQGRILFWTAPPATRDNGGLSATSAALGHSVKYLSDIDEWKREREAKRKARDEKIADEAKRRKAEEEAAAEAAREKAIDETAEYLAKFFRQHAEDTERFREENRLDKWDALMTEVHGKN